MTQPDNAHLSFLKDLGKYKVIIIEKFGTFTLKNTIEFIRPKKVCIDFFSDESLTWKIIVLAVN